jgi:glycerol-3-phosphate dehydrogenase (NAD+)
VLAGSGNWGSAIAKIVGQNAEQQPELFDREVKMWMYEEQVSSPVPLRPRYLCTELILLPLGQFEGRALTEQFNEKHENLKYLPGVKIAEGVVAEPDLVKACQGANALIFVTPHQFIPSICKQLHGQLPKGTRAISLVKGVDVHEDKIHIFSEVIEEHLGVSCAALSGANIANEVAKDAFSETTIGCRNKEDGERWVQLFHTNHFRVSLTDDVLGVSLAGALKNVVAVAAGLVDGMQMGNNAKVGPFLLPSSSPKLAHPVWPLP